MTELFLSTRLEISEGFLWRVWPLDLHRERIGVAEKDTDVTEVVPVIWVQVWEHEKFWIVPAAEGVYVQPKALRTTQIAAFFPTLAAAFEAIS
jgi:hypothetical protein